MKSKLLHRRSTKEAGDKKPWREEECPQGLTLRYDRNGAARGATFLASSAAKCFFELFLHVTKSASFSSKAAHLVRGLRSLPLREQRYAKDCA